jgi:hypothetical protein
MGANEPFENDQLEAISCHGCGKRFTISRKDLSTDQTSVLYCPRCSYGGAVRLSNDGNTMGKRNGE